MRKDCYLSRRRRLKELLNFLENEAKKLRRIEEMREKMKWRRYKEIVIQNRRKVNKIKRIKDEILTMFKLDNLVN